MKKLVILMVGAIMGFTTISCNKNIAKDKVVYVYIPDTVDITLEYANQLDSVLGVADKALNTCDSLNKVIIEKNNKLSEVNQELLVAKYKLKRIERYNKIAAKGNNIKYLRGWIRRTLK